jgi:RHS repeat-associated protein
MGQRVQKTGAGTYAFNAATASSFSFNARYVYDESGNLIGEYAPDGKLLTETVWFNGMPIATLRPKGSNSGTPLGISGTTTGNPANGATAANANNVGNNSTTNRVNVEVFYIHPDHLGTPRTITRSTVATGANAPSSANATSPGAINKAVWMWNSDPFGTTGTTGAGGSTNSAPNKNPQNITGTAAQIAAATFEQNLRMPGQVEDQETKKFYNWNRTYANDVGRYDSSDPIGLRGGINTFGYVLADPIVRADSTGLASESITDSACCRAVGLLLTSPGDAGVACCNGKKVACLWSQDWNFSSDGYRIARECVRRHERTHFGHTKPCDSCGTYDAIPKDRKRMEEYECEAYRAQKSCLDGRLKECKSAQCRWDLLRELGYVNSGIQGNCYYRTLWQ